MNSKYFRITTLALVSFGHLEAQDVFNSNGQPSSASCPANTRRFYASRFSYNPADGCLTPGQAYMQYGKGFPVDGSDIFSSGGPVIAQVPQMQQGGVTQNQQREQPPYYQGVPQYAPPTYVPTRPRLNGNSSSTRQTQVIDWKPYQNRVGQQLESTQNQGLNGVDANTLNRWRRAKIRADANFTTYPDGSISNVAVTSADPQYRAFIAAVLQSQNGRLPGFPQGTTASSQRIGWSFTVNQNFNRTGSTIERH